MARDERITTLPQWVKYLTMLVQEESFGRTTVVASAEEPQARNSSTTMSMDLSMKDIFNAKFWLLRESANIWTRAYD